MANKKKKVSKKIKQGRPEKITPELIDTLKSAILAGAYIETASAFAGIHRDTFYDWLKKGAAAKSGIYKDFSDTIKKATAEAEIRDVMLINRAAQTSWQAAAWKLERKFPDRWGQRAKLDLATNDKPVTINYKLVDS